MAKQRNPKGMGNYRKLADGRVGWRKTVDGETIDLSARTMTELQRKVKEVVDLPIIKEKCTVEEWFDKWLLIYVGPLRKKATYLQYSILYEQHIKPVIGNRKLSTIKTYDVQNVIGKMNKKNLSTKTMRDVKSIMNVAFKKAVADNLVAKSPVVNIEIPIKQTKERKTLTTEQMGLLFESMKNSRWIWSVHFALVTGLRRGELLALQWLDIDWENKQVRIDQSNSVTGLGDTKTSKIHYAPLSNRAIYVLKQQLLMLRRENNLTILNNDGSHKKDMTGSEMLIFPNRAGQMIRPDSYYTLVSRFAKKVGLSVSPHCFRHTFVYLMRGDLSVKELQNILGHSESTTTLDIYGDMIYNTAKKNAKQIDDVFAGVDANMQEIDEKAKEEIKPLNANVIPFRRRDDGIKKVL